MVYNSESELRDVAIEPLTDEFSNGNDVEYLEEYDYGAGRTDVVLGRISESYLSRRIHELGLRTPLLKSAYLRVFLLLHDRKKLTREYLSELCGRRGLAKKAIEWLEAKGFIKRTSDGKLRTAPNLRRHITRSYAVELKLKDWKMALKQAYRAKAYSNYQYVVMDSEYVHRAVSNIEEFQKYNIGIVSVDDSQALEVHSQPDNETPFNPTMAWEVNEKIFNRL